MAGAVQGKRQIGSDGKRFASSIGKVKADGETNENCCCGGSSATCNKCWDCCFSTESSVTVSWGLETPYFTYGDGASGGYLGTKIFTYSSSTTSTTWTQASNASPNFVSGVSFSCSEQSADGIPGPFWQAGDDDYSGGLLLDGSGLTIDQYVVHVTGFRQRGMAPEDFNTIVFNAGTCCGAVEQLGLIEVFHIQAGGDPDDPVVLGSAYGQGGVTFTVNNNVCCANEDGDCISENGYCDGNCDCHGFDLCGGCPDHFPCGGTFCNQVRNMTITISGSGADDGTYSTFFFDTDACLFEFTLPDGGIVTISSGGVVGSIDIDVETEDNHWLLPNLQCAISGTTYLLQKRSGSGPTTMEVTVSFSC